MALDDLLTALDLLDDEADRTRYVESVIAKPNHPHQDAIPDGTYPLACEWPDSDEIDAYESEQTHVWNHILTRFETTPDVLQEALFEYEANLARLRETGRMPEELRSNVPLSNLPDFRGRAILNHVKGAIPLWESEEITVDSISTNRLGNGGFADVHLLNEPDGSQKVIKFFRPEYLLEPDLRETRRERLEIVKENLFENRRFFSQDPFFANLRSIPYEFTFYIADYVEGRHLNELFESNDEECLNAGLFGLATVLEKVHDRGMVFVDVKPDSALIEENGNVRVCDYDFCMTEERVNATHDQFRLVKAPIYLPRESFDTSIPIGPTADLEQFAYVIDHAYNKRPFLNTSDFYSSAERARRNRREYPQERAQHVPEHVRDLVRAMLTYPRDETITARDFVLALDP